VLKRRYKDRPIEEATLLFVVCITLLPKEEAEKAGGAEGAKAAEQKKEDLGTNDDDLD
jgi:hypothetical protein